MFTGPQKPNPDKRRGKSHREDMAQRMRASSAAAAEIGELPAVVNPDRKEACRHDLHLFLTTYFPQSTGLKPFSEDHKRMIGSLQRCILFGGWMIRAVYRGFAKTTIGENACLWAALYGHREFIPLVGADNEAANGNLDSIKIELEGNDLLAEDFPEACYPIRQLEGKSQRAASQTLGGKLTRVEFSATQIVLPTIPGSDCSGICIKPTSIASYNRGVKHKMPDGRQVRPEFVFVDDPQTDESAGSPSQVQKRLSKLQRTILKSAGHSGQLAVYIAATVIEPDDLVHQLLDPVKSPQWDGDRVPMVRSWADKHEDLWMGRYAELRHGWDRSNPDDRHRAIRAATHFYDEHRAEMDAGCEVSWEHCYDEEAELSAIQHAYNMLIDDGPDVFAAECQNEPVGRIRMSGEVVRPDDVLQRLAGPERRLIPAWATKLVGSIDVQGNILWYTVMAFADDFTGCVVDYGAWPDQGRRYYTKADAKMSMADAWPGHGLEAQIRSSLDSLTGDLMGRDWRQESGGAMPIDLLLVDEGFQTPEIYEFVRRQPHGSRVVPAKGMAIGASGKPFEEYERRSGETLGLHWRWTRSARAGVRHIVHNPNYWKSFVWSRFRVPVGDPGSVVVFKGTANDHRMYADHIGASEYPVEVEGRGRTVNEWKLIPGRDNDLLDTTSLCYIGASRLGCELGHITQKRGKRRTKRRVSGDWAA